jgi:hypothetical protein
LVPNQPTASNAPWLKLQGVPGYRAARGAGSARPLSVLTAADNSAQQAPDAASHINRLRSRTFRDSPKGICPFLAAGLAPYSRHGEESRHSQKVRQNREIQSPKFQGAKF